MPKKIILATSNQGKVAEFKALVKQLPVELLTSKEIGYHQEIVENGSSFAENACIKAEALANYSKEWAIADDSGVVVPFLNGEPGIYSARYAGDEASDEQNNLLLLQKLEQANPSERAAFFVSEIALARPGFPTEVFRGECEGVILRVSKGDLGFGYDPLFWVSAFQMTFAELPLQVKNQISHRGRAMQKCLLRIEELLNGTPKSKS
jgi:XTP/dITP diphosphohydrolase